MVTSDFRPELEIRPFRACAMKNTPYNAYLWPNRRNIRVLKEIGVEEHNGDVAARPLPTFFLPVTLGFPPFFV